MQNTVPGLDGSRVIVADIIPRFLLLPVGDDDPREQEAKHETSDVSEVVDEWEEPHQKQWQQNTQEQLYGLQPRPL